MLIPDISIPPFAGDALASSVLQSQCFSLNLSMVLEVFAVF
jgi:hypothetical protein